MVTRVNRQILAPSVRVIEESGNNLGTMKFNDALEKAQSEGKDLIEIVPNALPPVCKIMEMGKYMYEQKKGQKVTKSPSLKEFQFSINIDHHDLETKARQIETLLDKKHPIKVIVRFRGRELAHMERGFQIISELQKLLPKYTIDSAKQEEKQLITSIRP
jgi:translation initiation factor IF-3